MPAVAERTRPRWSLRRWFVLMLVAVGIGCLVAFAAGAWALQNLAAARSQVVDEVDPAIRQALQLTGGLLNQESGLREFALTARPHALAPYDLGRAQEQQAATDLRRSAANLPDVRADLAEVQRQAARWRADYAESTIAEVRAGGTPGGGVATTEGKAPFDEVRAALNVLGTTLGEHQRAAHAELDRAASLLLWVCIAIAVTVLLITVALSAGLRAAAISPLSRLAAETRRVRDGDFRHEVTVTGPREVVALADDVESMRRRILHEVAELDARSHDLQRSNAELEQFAYVASHDLQEPLRKVASFCELLERRYHGRLDERADQYIGFAADGAKRMQVLINDLLSFSRVGRVTRERTLVDCDAVLAQATANLAVAVEETGAKISSDELPTVLAEVPLLTTVFQNLIGNAVKFHGPDPPRVHIGVRRDGPFWEFCCADNGIGIEPEYAERIFVIFQRLHAKGTYDGTGIGLAMCRKIIEYHDGRIWLDTTAAEGTIFRFTLPATEETEDADE